MPGPGRPPKPTALKLLEGNPGKRPLNAREPQPPAGAPKCPTWLASDAKREWRRIVPILEALQLVTKVDLAALAAYCQSFARWRQAEQVLSEGGLTVELKKANPYGREYVYAVQQRPEVTIAQKERQLMKAFLTEFGLTPASRSRLALPEQAPADPFEEWNRGRSGAS